jgi:hypothetical protein
VRVRISKDQLTETFRLLRDCGRGDRECQVLWLSPWHDPDRIVKVVHSKHAGHAFGFQLEDEFIDRLWLDLAANGVGVRVQVHTHPGEAFHSQTDDEWPIVHTAGFLSLVVPDFARGPVGFENTYLACIEANGAWGERRAEEIFRVEVPA